jgi:hypothetical protein
MTTHNMHKRQISISQAGFETAFAASERPQTDALDRAATEISNLSSTSTIFRNAAFNSRPVQLCFDFQLLLFCVVVCPICNALEIRLKPRINIFVRSVCFILE